MVRGYVFHSANNYIDWLDYESFKQDWDASGGTPRKTLQVKVGDNWVPCRQAKQEDVDKYPLLGNLSEVMKQQPVYIAE